MLSYYNSSLVDFFSLFVGLFETTQVMTDNYRLIEVSWRNITAISELSSKNKHQLTCGPMHGDPFVKTDICSASSPRSDVKSELNGVNPMYLKTKPHDGNHE